jgi:hypothetical protein
MGTLLNAYGNFMNQNIPFYSLGPGISTQYGTLLPPCSAENPVYVRSVGQIDGDSQQVVQRLQPTLARALAQCRSGYGDVIYVLPGHTENVVDATMLDNLVNGTRIIGVGSPLRDDAPTFTWTATAGSWAVDNNNVSFENLRLKFTGINTVVKAVNITGTGVSFKGCFVEMADTSLAPAIAFEVGSAAHWCSFIGNKMYGLTGQALTNGIKVVGATVPKGLLIAGNDLDYAVTEVGGNVNITVAATHVRIIGNIMANSVASSTANVVTANVAATGIIANNYFSQLNDGTVTAQGVIIGGSNVLIRCFENYACDEKAKSGILSPGVCT